MVAKGSPVNARPASWAPAISLGADRSRGDADRGEHRHGDDHRPGAGDDPAGAVGLRPLHSPPPAPERAAPDRRLDRPVRDLGDGHRRGHRHGELGDGQGVAGDAADALEDRPVVQVQPVAAGADPHQHDVAQRRSGDRALMGDGGDDGDGGDAGRQEAATEQPRIGALRRHHVQVPHQAAEDDEAGHADGVEQAAAPPHRPAHQRHRSPHHRQRRAEQQPAGPRRRRQVQELGPRDAPSADLPVGVRRDLARGDLAGRVQRGHDAGDGHGDDDQRPADVVDAARAEAQEPDHRQRPQDVELLLDGEAPEVAQRGEVARRRVPLPHPDLVPVGHVREPGDDVAAELAERVATEHRGERREQHERRQQRRQQAARPPEPELAQTDAPRPLVLADQQQGDEVAADDEEHLDAEEPAREPRVVGVVHHHGDDGERPQPVEAREVGHAADRPGRGRGGDPLDDAHRLEPGAASPSDRLTSGWSAASAGARPGSCRGCASGGRCAPAP